MLQSLLLERWRIFKLLFFKQRLFRLSPEIDGSFIDNKGHTLYNYSDTLTELLSKDSSEMKTFDVVVLGAGPGGYVAAIRASQLG